MAYMWQKPRTMHKQKANLMDFVHRTTMCKFYQTGRCNKGYSCTFAHSEDQLQSQPDLYKTSLCSKFTRKGFCKNGDQCKYAHGKDELREPILHQGSLSHSSSDSLGESLADLPDLPDRSHTSHISHISHSSGYLHDEGLNQLPLLTQDFPEDFVVKGERKDEEMSSDETCTPSPDSSSVASVDWSPQSTESSLMSEAHVRIKNTFLEFGCPTESTDTLRRSSSVPDLRLPVA